MIVWLRETTSTMKDAAALAARGEPHGTVKPQYALMLYSVSPDCGMGNGQALPVSPVSWNRHRVLLAHM